MLGEQYFRYIFEENNDTKGVIRNYKSKKDWQYNGEKKKKGESTNNGLQNTTQKTKESETRTIQINKQYIIKIKGGTGSI